MKRDEHVSAAGPSVLKRVLVIAALSAVIGGFAVFQGNAIMGRSGGAYRVKSGAAVVRPVEGSRFLRSYAVLFNGAKTTFAHYMSRLPAREVVETYAKASQSEEHAKPHPQVPMLGSTGSGCSVLSYGTEDGSTIGIVAFDNPESGGCDYLVGSMPSDGSEHAAGPSGDCPGREPPGVPRPPRSVRTLCIENLGGVPSTMLIYDAWGAPGELVEDLDVAMAELGWERRVESSQILTRNYRGEALLSFSRGREQCIVAVDREPETGKISILMFWAERAWLPEDTAL